MALGAPVDAEQGPMAGIRTLAFRYFDVVFVVVAAVVAIAVGAPALGCAIGAAGWIVQRVVQVIDRNWSRRLREPRQQLGVSLFERFGRIWLLAGVIVVAAVVGHRSDGAAAAIIIFCAYTIAFVTRMVTGPPPENPSTPRSKP